MADQLVKRVVVEVCLDDEVVVVVRVEEVLALAGTRGKKDEGHEQGNESIHVSPPFYF
jgi:hypothetical protein